MNLGLKRKCENACFCCHGNCGRVTKSISSRRSRTVFWDSAMSATIWEASAHVIARQMKTNLSTTWSRTPWSTRVVQIKAWRLAKSGRKFMNFFVCFNIGFRLFSLLSWIKGLNVFVRFSNTIYRTFLGLFIYAFFALILTIFWSMAFYITLRDTHPNFETFLKSFLSFFTHKLSMNTNE